MKLWCDTTALSDYTYIHCAIFLFPDLLLHSLRWLTIPFCPRHHKDVVGMGDSSCFLKIRPKSCTNRFSLNFTGWNLIIFPFEQLKRLRHPVHKWASLIRIKILLCRRGKLTKGSCSLIVSHITFYPCIC